MSMSRTQVQWCRSALVAAAMREMGTKACMLLQEVSCKKYAAAEDKEHVFSTWAAELWLCYRQGSAECYSSDSNERGLHCGQACKR